MGRYKCLNCDYSTEVAYELFDHFSNSGCDEGKIGYFNDVNCLTRWQRFKIWVSELDYGFMIPCISGCILNGIFIHHVKLSLWEVIIEPLLFGLLLARILQ